MHIDNLIIELTRRCNMTCNHCLRGTAQNKDIDLKAMDRLLKHNNIKYISTITFTGGEPSLNIKAIKHFIKTCKKNNIEVGSFYIATNGKTYSSDFLKVLIDLYCFCSDNEISLVEISRSDYHMDQDEHKINKLKCLKFVRDRIPLKYDNLINMGKAKELNFMNGEGGRINKIYPLTIEDDSIEGEVYLNVRGDICSSCDLSYVSQNRHKLGNILTESLENMIKKQSLKGV